MRNIKKYKLNSDYTTNKKSFEYPTVSYVEENKEVYYTQKPPIVTYATTGASQQVKLISKQEYLDYCKILDTDEELSVTGTGVLNYTFTEPGEHKVELKFKDDATTLISCFSGCSQLTSIPENLFSNNTAVTSFSQTFYQCSGLTSIPANLFKYNTAVTNFSETFYGCSGLTSIPETLFKYNTAVTTFTSTFYACSQLTSIPANLFSNNTAVTSFSHTFNSCLGLTSIPANLFSNNTAVTSFYNAFNGCTGLTSIPANLFKYNTAVTDFMQTFLNCTSLTGNVPTDTDGTPIYNRSTPGKEGYAIVTSHTDCFYNCTGLTDYSSIPSSWGGNITFNNN